jgi:hypothetical protein
VQRGVGSLEHRLKLLNVLGGDDPGAHRDRRHALRVVSVQGGAYAFGELSGARQIGVGQQRHELLAAHPGDRVDIA